MKQKVFWFGLIVLLILTFFGHQSKSSVNDEEVYIFQIKIAADKHYQSARKDWQKDIKSLIKEINREFKKQNIKVKFEITEIVSWAIDDKTETLLEALYDLERRNPLGNFDLIIGLTRKEFSQNCDAAGYYLSPGYIIVKDYTRFDFWLNEINEPSWTLAILIHEIGHFFDLDHSDNPSSVMYDKFLSVTNKFLKEEVEWINKKAREMKLGAPLK